MLGFYILSAMVTAFVLFFAPFISATRYEQYHSTNPLHLTDRSRQLAEAIRWGVVTVICTVIFLYSAWGIKEAIFSKLGYLC